ncbi:U8 snoRNA-decapping enzyme-like isoform X2 [Ornithodoros turicata]
MRKYPLDRAILRELSCIADGFDVVLPEELPLVSSSGYHAAAHCFLWSPSDRVVELSRTKYSIKAVVLMHLRFDGLLGFFGGIVEEGEPPSVAVTREMREEGNLDTNKFTVNEADHLVSLVSHDSKLLTHFYALEVSSDEMDHIEKNASASEHYGTETFGLVRVPLFTMSDGVKGFPTFLSQHFSGSAKSQLTYALARLGILGVEYIKRSLEISKQYK